MSSGIYKDLHNVPGRIRLLTLHPPSDASATEEEVQCTLHEADLDQDPEYSALSYTWGDSKDTMFIELEGIQFSVTRNLHEALSALRSETPLTLWADALCINQSSIPERNSQVAMMGHIYGSAAEVLIWVGPSFEDSGLAFDLIRKWSKYAVNPREIDEFQLESFGGFREEEWHAARQLFACTYWSRVWVYQEVVLAKKAILICGEDRVDWFQLEWAIINWAAILKTRQRDLITTDEEMLIRNCKYGKASAINFHRLVRSMTAEERTAKTTRAQTLDHLLRINHMTATDPRDKLYALLGVADDTYGLTVDYGKTVEQVYTGYVRAYIEKTGLVDIIARAGYKADPPLELPSWVPDFRWIRKPNKESAFASDLYRASGDVEPVIDFPEDECRVSIKGFIFDSVKEASPPEMKMDVGPTKRDMVLRACPKASYPDGTPVWQAFIRTMIGDSHLKSANSAEEFCKLAVGFLLVQEYLGGTAMEMDMQLQPEVKEALEDFYPYVKTFVQWTGTLPDDISNLDEKTLLEPLLGPPGSSLYEAWVPVDTDPYSYEGQINRKSHAYDYTMKYEQYRRRFFTTSNGYMGLGLETTVPGDLICILYGCEKPIIIRPRGDAYIVVGECYVQGMMFGEALKGVESGKYEERILTFE